MKNQETITLNGKTYVEVDPNATEIKPAVDTDLQAEIDKIGDDDE